MSDAIDRTGRLDAVFTRLGRFISDGETDGAALAVALDGELVAEWYEGEARPGLPADSRTLWPLASISKLYTAAAVMALVERGDLYLSMPIGNAFPGFNAGGGDARDTITVKHLLTHSSGLIYESPRMEELLVDQTPLDGIIAEGTTYPLEFPPGTSERYSDFGFLLLGALAGVVSGRPFPDLLNELVIEPTGLRDTSLRPEPELLPRIAYVRGVFAEGTGGALYNSTYALDLAHPAFGVVATASDLLRFGLLFANDGVADRRRVLSSASVRAMITEQAPAPGVSGRGLAFRLKTPLTPDGDLLGPGSYGHGGASGCILWVDPAARIVIAYVSNRHSRADRGSFTRRLAVATNMVLAALA